MDDQTMPMSGPRICDLCNWHQATRTIYYPPGCPVYVCPRCDMAQLEAERRPAVRRRA